MEFPSFDDGPYPRYSTDSESQTSLRSRPLCSGCEAIILWTKTSNRNEDEKEVFEHQPSYEALQASASTCPLCYFVMNVVFSDSNWRGDKDKEPLKYQAVVHVEGDVRRRVFSIRWREMPLYPSPSIQDTAPYYFVAPNYSGGDSVLRLNKPGLDACLGTVAAWITDCKKHHSECGERVSTLPKRLLDLEQAQQSECVKLLESTTIGDNHIRYATLSHCWGPKTSDSPLRTTSENIKEHIGGIPLDELTLNFRHAVLVCLKLGIRYLWIDSLCIIQDSKIDWEVEAAKMADIYRGSYLNIAAVAASDAHGGFIREASVENQRDRVTEICYSIPATNDMDTLQESISLQPGLGVEEFRQLSAGTYPYFSRGWILQEQILAPRTVLFPRGQVFWQCRHCSCSEDGTLWSKAFLTLSNGDPTSSTTFDFSSPHLGQITWQLWVRSYVQRQLSYASDVGPALSGLVRFFSSRMGYTPMLGLWKENLPWNLGWRISHPSAWKENGKPGKENNFPSWSWLSALPLPDSGAYFTQSLLTQRTKANLDIEIWEEKWSGLAYTSKLESSRLVVSGLVRDKTLTFDGTEYQASSEKRMRHSISLSDSPSSEGKWSVEYPFPSGKDFKVKLLYLDQSIVGTFPQGSLLTDHFLVIMERFNSPGCFFRVGLGDIRIKFHTDLTTEDYNDVHFKKANRETVELV